MESLAFARQLVNNVAIRVHSWIELSDLADMVAEYAVPEYELFEEHLIRAQRRVFNNETPINDIHKTHAPLYALLFEQLPQRGANK